MTFARFRSHVLVPLVIVLSVLGLVVSIHDWSNGDAWAWRTIAFILGQLFLLAGSYQHGARLTKTRTFLITAAISLTLVGWVGIVLKARGGSKPTAAERS